ncbi:PorT family protein [Aquiflexum sp. TKW24L]|uniref:porin family protein n=1 Tax=Aquiflexum sp. TKW24L TaxID=2942212 RepID=UPI0020BE31BA|nr:porin family protein [Aquiflexum sp. TKW24L]MCL6261191.1 PorT family protein [Aquiflexum sp. TKW24L]
MKHLLFLISAIILSFSVMAQDFSIGPKAGISTANIKVNGDGFESGDSEFGYHLGLFVRMGGSSIFMQPEILFTSTGGSVIKTDNNGVQTDFNANFNRLDIPIMFGLKFLNFFRVQAGPIASVLVDYQIEDALKVPVEVDYKTSSFGYQAGLGMDLGNLIFDLKYESSLSKMSKSSVAFQTDQRQNQIILSAGFRLF